MTIALSKACNTFIGTILFGLLELSKITLFKDLVGKIIEVAESGFFCSFPRLWSSLNKVYIIPKELIGLCKRMGYMYRLVS